MAKIGVGKKSINDFAEAYRSRDTDIKKIAKENKTTKNEAKAQVGSFWSYLSKPKESTKKQPIDVDEMFPKLEGEGLNKATERISEMSIQVAKNETTWQELFNTDNKRERHYAKLGQQLEGQIIETENVAAANDKARESIIEQNKAMKEQTLGAKASKFAFNALATVGNMAFNALISYGITKAIEAWDNYANAQENAIERGDEAFDRMQQNQSKIANAQSVFDSIKSNTVISDNGREITRFEQLSQGVNALNENVSLTKSEFEEYNSILNQLSGAGLTATTSMSNLENQIKSLRQSANYDTLEGFDDWIDGFNAKNNQFATDFTKEIGYQQKINAIDEVFRTGNLERTNIDDVVAKDMEATNALMSGATSEETNRIINEAEILRNEQLQLETNSEALKEIAETFNIDIFDEDGAFSEEKFQLPETQKKLKDAQEMLVSQVESMVRQSAGYLQARFENNPHFDELSETTANMVSGIFNNLKRRLIVSK